MNDAELGAMIERPRLSGLHLVPVLAGGGTRLAAHVGVLAALDDLGVASATRASSACRAEASWLR